MTVAIPASAPPGLSLGVTGHRTSNPTLAANMPAVRAVLAGLFDQIDAVLAGLGRGLAPVRFHSLLVSGVDQVGAELALGREWELVAPLPFGHALNTAINAQPRTADDARALIAGGSAADADVKRRAAEIRNVAAHAHLFELADRDETIAELFVAALENPGDFASAKAFDTQCSDQVALAGKVMIERIDLLVAVWDRKISNLPGGTGHTIVMALDMGAPVLIIDPDEPSRWSIYSRPEELALEGRRSDELLVSIVTGAVGDAPNGSDNVPEEHWHKAGSSLWTFYRRIEAVFGGEQRPFRNLVADYERPDQIAAGSAAPLLAAARALPHGDDALVGRIAEDVLPQFAWADGISTWLSDAYRSGMSYNFIFAALAVIVGAAYDPLGLEKHKWMFAVAELLMLLLILLITSIGRRHRWHARWLETRRVAEYLRHGPIMLLLGVTRPTGRWPRSEETDWPEHFARHCLRATGLPRIALDKPHLRAALQTVVLPHVTNQGQYHRTKAERLATVHHRLDKLAGALFIMTCADQLPTAVTSGSRMPWLLEHNSRSSGLTQATRSRAPLPLCWKASARIGLSVTMVRKR